MKTEMTLKLVVIITDRIRSVGESYVFTSICLFTRGVWSEWGVLSEEVYGQKGV